MLKTIIYRAGNGRWSVLVPNQETGTRQHLTFDKFPDVIAAINDPSYFL